MDDDDDRAVLVVGATGFVGRRVVAKLLAGDVWVRCLARHPERAADLTAAGAEVVGGDMLLPDTIARAVRSARAVIVCVHTLSPQTQNRPGQSFTDVEETGLRNIAAACRTQQVRRLLYVTSIGVAANGSSSWLRGRARIEQMLFDSGLDITVLRPGMIVGHGGAGFGLVERGARRPLTVLLSSPIQRFRTIAVDDLADQLIQLMDRPDSYGQHYDVGSDDILTVDQMIDLTADHLGRRPPVKIHLPRRLVARLAPLIERAAHLPPGAIGGFVGEGSDADMIGNTTPISVLLDHPPRPFHHAMAETLAITT